MKVALINGDSISIKSTNVETLNQQYIFTNLIRNDKFINFDLGEAIFTLREYFAYYLLTFIMGMTEESVLQHNYLNRYKKYLGYAQLIMFKNDVHILGNIDITGIPILSVKEIFDINDINNLSDDAFKKQVNSCLLYLDMFQNEGELAKNMLRFAEAGEEINDEKILRIMKSFSKREISDLYQKLVGRINVEKI